MMQCYSVMGGQTVEYKQEGIVMIINNKMIGVKDQRPIYIKRIKHYVYQTRNVLGKGNFSKVYAGTNELTSIQSSIQMNQQPSKSYKWNPSKTLNYQNSIKIKDKYFSNSTIPTASTVSTSSTAITTATSSPNSAPAETLISMPRKEVFSLKHKLHPSSEIFWKVSYTWLS